MPDRGQLEIAGLLDEVHPLQEEYGAGDPWRVLVICLLLNQTDGRMVARELPGFFRRFPDPHALAGAGEGTVRLMLEHLGLYRRARLLVDLSRAYLAGGWEDPTDLPGVGDYAADAWRLFVDEDPWFDPQDKVLRAVAARMRAGSVSDAPPVVD